MQFLRNIVSTLFLFSIAGCITVNKIYKDDATTISLQSGISLTENENGMMQYYGIEFTSKPDLNGYKFAKRFHVQVALQKFNHEYCSDKYSASIPDLSIKVEDAFRQASAETPYVDLYNDNFSFDFYIFKESDNMWKMCALAKSNFSQVAMYVGGMSAVRLTTGTPSERNNVDNKNREMLNKCIFIVDLESNTVKGVFE